MRESGRKKQKQSQNMKNMTNAAADTKIPNSECTVQNGQQLSLSFLGSCRPSAAFRRHQMLRSRAQHWFGIMRRVVDSAVEWKPAPRARPEQTSLDLHRATEVHLMQP
jgi:hypothetical protein